MRFFVYWAKTLKENIREWKISIFVLVFGPFFVYMMYAYFGAATPSYAKPLPDAMRFDNFVVGPGSKFPVAAAVAVAEPDRGQPHRPHRVIHHNVLHPQAAMHLHRAPKLRHIGLASQQEHVSAVPEVDRLAQLVLEPVEHAKGKSHVVPCIDTVRIQFDCLFAALDLFFEPSQLAERKTPAHPGDCELRILFQRTGELLQRLLVLSFTPECKTFEVTIPSRLGG